MKKFKHCSIGIKDISSNIKREASDSKFHIMHSIQRLKDQLVARYSCYTGQNVIFQGFSNIALLASDFNYFWLRSSITSVMSARHRKTMLYFGKRGFTIIEVSIIGPMGPELTQDWAPSVTVSSWTMACVLERFSSLVSGGSRCELSLDLEKFSFLLPGSLLDVKRRYEAWKGFSNSLA